MEFDTKNKIANYFIFSKKNDNYIVVFPDIPYWIATIELGIVALNEIKEGKTLSEIAIILFKKNTSYEKNILMDFFSPLEKSYILYKEDELIPKNSIFLPQKPNKITFLQTMNCNLKCKHCCVSDMPQNHFKSMNLEKAKEALIRCKDIMHDGNKEVSFLGGEPLCGEKFTDLLDYAYNIGFIIGLSTNGILVDEKFALTAKKNKINVQISLDGPNKESHEFIRGLGTWEKTINSIDLLIKHNVDIQTNLVYHNKNIDLLEEYFDFALNKGIKKVRLISLMNMGRAKNEFTKVPLDEFVDRIYDLIKKRPDLISLLDETSFMGLIMCAKFSQRLISCGAGIITVTISPNGDIYPCLNLYNDKFKINNIFDKNYKETFENSSVRKMLKKLNVSSINKKCSKCNLKYFCGGKCRGESYHETDDIYAPYPDCDSWKKALEKIFWILVEFPELGEDKYLKIKNASGEYLNLWH